MHYNGRGTICDTCADKASIHVLLHGSLAWINENDRLIAQQSELKIIQDENVRLTAENDALRHAIEHFCDNCAKHDRNDIYNTPMTI